MAAPRTAGDSARTFPGEDIVQSLQHRLAQIFRGSIAIVAGWLTATPAFAAGAPGIGAWSALAMFAALVILACVVVHRGGHRRASDHGPSLGTPDVATGESH